MAKTIWITGLPGSGKSTISEAIKKRHPDFIILRMDALRKVVTPEPTYSEEERDIVYRTIVYIASLLNKFRHSVIIDATGNLRKWRNLAREIMPSYAEVYLKCDIKVCEEREKKRLKKYGAPEGIYRKGEKGSPVPGVNVPYEQPVNPELILDTEKLSIDEIVDRIESQIIHTF